MKLLAFEGGVEAGLTARVFYTPDISDNGEVAFFALPTGEGTGLFLYDGVQTQMLLASGVSAPDGNGLFFGVVGAPVISNTQAVAFRGSLQGTSGGNSDSLGVFLAANGVVTQLAREGRPTPDEAFEFDNFLPPLINGSGQVAFEGRLRGLGVSSLRQAIYRHNGAVLQEVARFDTTLPGETDPLGVMASLSFNDLGHVAFVGQSTDRFGQNEGPFRSVFADDGTGLTTVARQGQPSGSTGLFFDTFTGAALNNAGTIQFRASLSDADGLDAGVGLFRSVNGAVTPLVVSGDPTPDGIGEFSEIGMNYSPSHVNDAGVTPFWARFTTPAGESSGLFLASPEGVVEVVRSGDVAPDGNGVFGVEGLTNGGFTSLNEINAAGQFGFSARLSGTSGGTMDDEASFLYDGARVVTIVREGQPLAVGPIDAVTSLSGGQLVRINDSGQAVFQFRTEDGATGAALFTPTEHLAGDFNTDGVVDAADYTVWRDNADGQFTPADYALWRDNFGATATAPTIAAPAPGAVSLLAASLLLGGRCSGIRLLGR